MQTEKPKKHKMGSPLTQVEFDLIKEEQFRGETIWNAAARAGRSASTARIVYRATTLADYFRLSRELYLHKTDTPTRLVRGTPTLPSKEARYARLDEMKRELETVLADFLFAELTAAHRDLLRENTTLKERVTALEAENTQLKIPVGPRFSEKVADKLRALTPVEEGKE